MPAISHAPASRTWLLRTPATAYALRIDADGIPRHLHWGGPLTLPQAESLPLRDGLFGRSSFEGRTPVGEELPVDGGERFGPPSLQLLFADGARSFEWTPDGHTSTQDTLLLHFRDRSRPLRVTLGYQVHQDGDAVERWTVISNLDDSAPVTVLRADSAAWSLPPRDDYRLSHTTGLWAAETQLRRSRLPYGETVLTSRLGTTGHQAQPWAMLDAGDADEQHGQVWSTALAWSGTWRTTVSRTPDNTLGLTSGAGHEGLRFNLAPGASHTTPRLAGIYSDAGFGGTTRAWHTHIRAHVLPHPEETRPVLYNSWEATGFDVTQAGQQRLAAHAAALGVELFVMDDGWFGGRRSDRAGLGDWTPHPGAFPQGLQPLVDTVHGLGMKFGLWVEPEMVNPDSDLYRAHPDWVLHQPDRRRTELRNQLVLDFSRPEVADWAHGWLTRLVGEHGIDFLKWDMNRPFTETGSAAAAPADQDRVWTDYVQHYYAVLDRLRADHPALRIEACSGGGGRVDLGVLARTDQVWPSDNTDGSDRLLIQDGYAQVYPVRTMAAWVTDVPNQQSGRSLPLRFRFHSAMSGLLSLGGDLNRWTPAELKEAEGYVAEYKTIRHLVQHGALHRLRPVQTHGLTAVQYTAADASEAVVFGWLQQPRFGLPQPPLRLAALHPAARYRELRTGTVHHGAVLLEHGLELRLPPGDWSSTVVHLVRD